MGGQQFCSVGYLMVIFKLKENAFLLKDRVNLFSFFFSFSLLGGLMFTDEVLSSNFNVTLSLKGYFRKFSRNLELSKKRKLAVFLKKNRHFEIQIGNFLQRFLQEQIRCLCCTQLFHCFNSFAYLYSGCKLMFHQFPSFHRVNVLNNLFCA